MRAIPMIDEEKGKEDRIDLTEASRIVGCSYHSVRRMIVVAQLVPHRKHSSGAIDLLRKDAERLRDMSVTEVAAKGAAG
jgi:hypothetical protein